MRTIIVAGLVLFASVAWAGGDNEGEGYDHGLYRHRPKKVIIIKKTEINKTYVTNNNEYVTNNTTEVTEENTYINEEQQDKNQFDWGQYFDLVLAETENTEWGVHSTYTIEDSETRVYVGGKVYLNRLLGQGPRADNNQ